MLNWTDLITFETTVCSFAYLCDIGAHLSEWNTTVVVAAVKQSALLAEFRTRSTKNYIFPEQTFGVWERNKIPFDVFEVSVPSEWVWNGYFKVIILNTNAKVYSFFFCPTHIYAHMLHTEPLVSRAEMSLWNLCRNKADKVTVLQICVYWLIRGRLLSWRHKKKILWWIYQQTYRLKHHGMFLCFITYFCSMQWDPNVGDHF